MESWPSKVKWKLVWKIREVKEWGVKLQSLVINFGRETTFRSRDWEFKKIKGFKKSWFSLYIHTKWKLKFWQDVFTRPTDNLYSWIPAQIGTNRYFPFFLLLEPWPSVIINTCKKKKKKCNIHPGYFYSRGRIIWVKLCVLFVGRRWKTGRSDPLTFCTVVDN